MPKYLVSVYWREYGTVTVDAATPREAAECARHMTPDDVTGSGIDDWAVVDDNIQEV